MIVRYLLVPSVMMTVFAAVAIGGWTMVPAARACAARGRRGAAITIVGLAYTAVQPPSLERFNNELSFRGEQGAAFRRLLETGVVERGVQCGAVSVPTHKLIPDTLGPRPPEQRVVARSDPSAASQRKARYGVAIFPVGRTNILRTGFAVNTDAITQVPGPGFRIATKSTSPHTCAARAVRERLRRRAPSPSGLALGGILALAFGLRLLGDQARAAVRLQRRRGPRTSSPRPSATTSPTATTRITSSTRRRSHACSTWCSGPGSAAAGHSAPRTRSGAPTRPIRTACSSCPASPRRCSARPPSRSSATGARLYDRRVGLVAAALMAVLPVFYSHLALNDVLRCCRWPCPPTAAREC